MILVESLVKRFGDLSAVDGVSFGVARGEILGVLGPNGAGKTTTLRILCGYLDASSGRVEIDGLDIAERSVEVRRRIGYLPENNPLHPEMRVSEYLSFRAALKRVPRRERAERIADVAVRCGLDDVLRRTIGTLSKGYRQRVGLADALVASPPLLILDEPTVGLDPNQVVEVRELIRGLRDDHTVLLSSHYLPEIEQICDRVVIFHRGRVIAEDSTGRLSERLSGTVDLVVEGAEEDAQRLERLLEPLGTVSGTDRTSIGWVRFELAASEDVREEIFREAAREGIVLRELSRRRATLEQVFQSLTVAPAGSTDAAGRSE